MYHLDANANTETSSPSPPPLQYPTADLEYSQYYDYSEGATGTISTDEYTEPQVNEKIWKLKCCGMILHLSGERNAAAGLGAEF